MTTKRLLIAGVLGLSVLLAACGGAGGTGNDGATEQPATHQPAEVTEAPEVTEQPAEVTEAPDATDDGSGSGTTGEDPETLTDLAKLLPREANGITYNRAGFNGDQFGVYGMMSGLDETTLNKLLKDNGKTLNDLNFAIASPADSSNTAGGFVYVIQVEGVAATKWAGDAADGVTDMPKTSVAGKDVYGQAAMGFGAFYYLKDDMMFMILLTDEKTATDIVRQLP